MRGSTDESRVSRTSSRRRFLATALGTVAAVAAPATVFEPPTVDDDTESPATIDEQRNREAIEDRFETVVEMVDAGADPSGEESITPILREHRGDDTLFEFRSGRYFMDEQFRFSDFTNLGFVGSDATIVPASYHAFEGPPRCFKLGTYYAPGTGLLVDGLTFDITERHTGVRAIQAQVADDLVVRDVSVDGVYDTATWGPALFDIIDPNGEGTVERLRIPDGGRYTENVPGDIWVGPTGILVSQYHRGRITLRDCELGGFPDNGLYACRGTGQVHVRGGEYRNSNVASIRLGGNGSSIVGTRFVVDKNRRLDRNQRAIRLDQDDDLRVEDVHITLERPNGHAIIVQNKVGAAEIRDAKIEILNAPAQGVVVSPRAGAVELVDTTIRHESAGNSVNLRAEDGSIPPTICRRLTITGDADGATGRSAIRCERSDSGFDELDVTQTGKAFRRCLELGGDGCRVSNSTLRSTHYPIVNNASGTELESVTAVSTAGYEALQLLEGHTDVTITDSVLENGVLDRGTDGLVLERTHFG